MNVMHQYRDAVDSRERIVLSILGRLDLDKYSIISLQRMSGLENCLKKEMFQFIIIVVDQLNSSLIT